MWFSVGLFLSKAVSDGTTHDLILSMACSTQRGYGRTHAFGGELRIGNVAVEMDIPELGFSVEIGEIELTECETVNQFKGSKTKPPQFTRGYGLVFGPTERKAIAICFPAKFWELSGKADRENRHFCPVWRGT